MKPSLSILFTFSLLPVFLFGQVSPSNTSIKIEATFMASNSFTVDILHNIDSIFIYYKFHDSTSKQIKNDTSYSNCRKFLMQTIESGNIDSAVIIMDSCEKMGEKYESGKFQAALDLLQPTLIPKIESLVKLNKEQEGGKWKITKQVIHMNNGKTKKIYKNVDFYN